MTPNSPSAPPPQPQLNALVALCNAGQVVRAEQVCRDLLRNYPQSPMLWNILGGVLTQQEKYEQAVQCCNTMLQLNPGFIQAYYNRGVALQKLGRLSEAAASLRQAIQLKPDYAQAHSDLALILLLQGDFAQGWKHHEWRMQAEREKQQVPAPYPQWRGEPLKKKTILVRAEQGIGDEVMFASCFPDLVGLQPGQIIVECDTRLVSLLQRAFPSMNVQGNRESKNLRWLDAFGDIDFQVAIGDLPGFFRSQAAQFPRQNAYLQPQPALLEKWRERFRQLGDGLKIGLSWRGGSNDSMKKMRSIEPALWTPLLQSGATFVNLQYGDCAAEIDQFEQASGVRINDWEDADPLTDLENFTAQIAALDLVISIDNSTVHFAGAVGTPTWVLLPAAPDWRWMLERSDTLWYNSLRLFRQGETGGWPPVFDELGAALAKRLAEQRA
ncbi:MAG TPA: tetratricopeptide repeat protein [Thiotrichales bacterium]|nr:tetratricopeptide repeat protein [Thiotrichales bacterium]